MPQAKTPRTPNDRVTAEAVQILAALDSRKLRVLAGLADDCTSGGLSCAAWCSASSAIVEDAAARLQEEGRITFQDAA